MARITEHIILKPAARKLARFYFNNTELLAPEGEALSSALIANGIHVFSHHHKDKTPQGIFCANGQCAQCTVMADGLPVKSCVTPVREGMRVSALAGLPQLPELKQVPAFHAVEKAEPDVLVIGGGPAGLAAAAYLGQAGLSVLLVDDKHALGGKLVLQTHKFFGSVNDCFAGTRGIDIAKKLEARAAAQKNVTVWLNSFAVAVYSDKKVGVLKNNAYCLVRPKALLVAAGAREKSLPFPGNTLPGVYGAGAFQTLVNRDLVRPSKRLFILGGGNVGLIAGYHALQAGIEVAGLAEAMPEVGGYKVHADKLKRLGVPIYTSHTVLGAEGAGKLEAVTIAGVDKNFKRLPGTAKRFKVDTLLVAVGLTPCAELHDQAKSFGMPVFAAGDAEEIAEASAAIFSGKIAGHKIARALGAANAELPGDWAAKLQILKSRPGKTLKPKTPDLKRQVFPVLHCFQEIPCDPCAHSCPRQSIKFPDGGIMSVPVLDGDCSGCTRCVAACPALAISLVDFRGSPEMPLVTLAYEISRGSINKSDTLEITDADGNPLCKAKAEAVRDLPANNNTLLVSLRIPKEHAHRAAGIKISECAPPEPAEPQGDDNAIVCRCERVRLKEIKEAIKNGIRDINELKAATRACMGACGGKTCTPQILSAFRAEGVPAAEITQNTARPLEMETRLGQFCNAGDGPEKREGTGSSNF